jgi:hypothetical protein
MGPVNFLEDGFLPDLAAKGVMGIINNGQQPLLFLGMDNFLDLVAVQNPAGFPKAALRRIAGKKHRCFVFPARFQTIAEIKIIHAAGDYGAI